MNSQLRSDANVFWPRLKEQSVFSELKKLDQFCVENHIPYALFGGIATAAFLGQFVRPLRDIDVLTPKQHVSAVHKFLRDQRFTTEDSSFSHRAGFEQFRKRTDSGEIALQLFPGAFTLIDGTSRGRQLWAYNFSEAIDRAQDRVVCSLDGSERVTVKVIPLEDLIVSKLWPYFESNMLFDLAFLLHSVVPNTSIDQDYLNSRLETASPLMIQQCADNLFRFNDAVRLSVVLNTLANDSKLEQSVKLLKESFQDRVEQDLIGSKSRRAT
jgi:hypothetical protein